MKKILIITTMMLCLCLRAGATAHFDAQQGEFIHYTPLSARIVFADGTDSSLPAAVGLEVAAFLGDELRGAGTVEQSVRTGVNTLSVCIWGEPGEVYRFLLYDPAKDTETRLSGVVTGDYALTETVTLRVGGIAADDIKEGGWYADGIDFDDPANSELLDDNGDLQLHGEWTAEDIQRLIDILDGNTDVHNVDVSGADLGDDVTDEDLIDLGDKGNADDSEGGNTVITGKETIVVDGVDVEVICTPLVEIEWGEPYVADKWIKADRVTFTLPLHTDGTYDAICLPFEPRSLTTEGGPEGEMYDFALSTLDSIAVDVITFIPVPWSDMTAYTPYLIQRIAGKGSSHEAVMCTFHTDNLILPPTREETVTGFAWMATCDYQEVIAAIPTWTIDEEGTHFVLTTEGTIAPWTAYFILPDRISFYDIKVDEEYCFKDDLTVNYTLFHTTLGINEPYGKTDPDDPDNPDHPDGPDTGIADLQPDVETQIFDLLGRPVDRLTGPGIYIRNGRKVIVR